MPLSRRMLPFDARWDYLWRMQFYKMNGCGNAFAIFDARQTPFALTAEAARAIANPESGAGCDQGGYACGEEA